MEKAPPGDEEETRGETGHLALCGEHRAKKAWESRLQGAKGAASGSEAQAVVGNSLHTEPLLTKEHEAVAFFFLKKHILGGLLPPLQNLSQRSKTKEKS